MNDAFSKLESMGREPSVNPPAIPDHPSETARKKNEASKASPAKSTDVPKQVSDEVRTEEPPVGEGQGVEEGAEAKPGLDKPKPGEPQKPKKPSDFLREELAKQKARAEAYEKELTALKMPKEDPEKKELTEKVTAAEKRANEREEELRFANYERSEEYQNKYFKPYVEAFNSARQKITQLDIVEIKHEDPASGEERIVQAGRAAVPEDFDRIAQMPSDREARKLAKQLFGEDYAIAMAQREKVLELNSTRQTALNEQRAKGAEREKQQLEQRTKAQAESAKQRTELWSVANKEFAEKHKEWFEPIEGDEVGNKMLTNDLATTDSLFGDVSHLPPDKVVQLHSQMRNRAAAAGRLAHLLKKAQTDLAAAVEKLKGYEGSEPKEGDGVTPPAKPSSSNAMDNVFMDIDKRAKPASNFY